ncbi:josephin-like protein [Parasponia andersonii]|uniref:Josephin-like protein n=1 Tax=Parasponia andersonii TaxID=3476 RepID=A0A2P5B471_PARAD|nr:josephin-like protein [Parasponia andersonii]
MSRKDRRVNFSPDVNSMPMSDFLKRSVSFRPSPGSCRKRVAGVWSFRLQQKDSKYYSPIGFLRSLRAKVARAICLVSNKRRSSGKVSASNLPRCRSVSDPMDSHRAEALEDCIEFLNSSASLKRTNSVSSNY